MKASQVGFKKMNWLPKQSVWKEMQAARTKRAQMVKDFQSRAVNLANTINTTLYNQSMGTVENVIKSAADRVISEGQDKLKTQMDNALGGLVDLEV